MKKQFPITGDQLLQRQPDMVFSHIDDEVVMMSVETGEYYGLNVVASRIWELLKNPYTFNQLTDLLMQEFEIDEITCQKDVMTFLAQLIDRNLLIVK